MLLKDFYKVLSLEKKEHRYEALIRVNEKHEVFLGHFPGNPVMPGVCMMQIIKELVESITESTLFMQSLSNVKFMALINPEITPVLRLELEIITTEEDLIKVKNSTFFNEITALKLSCVYKKTSP
ncbi:MAG: 3-hydroxyacyl-ACP dehydratase [Burkholderiales bacterium]|nr:3-hydroxyacyl-ACP dehydratase [Flavobacterium sp.]